MHMPWTIGPRPGHIHLLNCVDRWFAEIDSQSVNRQVETLSEKYAGDRLANAQEETSCGEEVR
jgi:hypothetical protein